MSTIDVGTGMRSADIPDGREDYPDVGTCPVCRNQGRLTKGGGLRQHWRRSWPRRTGNPPCPGTGQQPSILNEHRVTRYLAAKRIEGATITRPSSEDTDVSETVQRTVDDITETDVKQIVGWIGRHALPQTLAHGTPEYSTGLALDVVVTQTAAHLKARLPLGDDPADRNAVRTDWNLIVAAARVWSSEPGFPGWQPIID